MHCSRRTAAEVVDGLDQRVKHPTPGEKRDYGDEAQKHDNGASLSHASSKLPRISIGGVANRVSGMTALAAA
jgi:hypothetical protein